MRHNVKKGLKLGTDASHTKAMKKSLAKALFENADSMEHDKAKYLDAEYAVSGFDDMPIHPGALQYYTEIGVK